MDRGGTLGSDGLLESGLDFFAFSTEVRYFGFEEAESLSEVGDGEVCHGFWIPCVWVARGDKMMWTGGLGNRHRPLPQLYTCTGSKEKVCSIATDCGGAESAEQ